MTEQQHSNLRRTPRAIVQLFGLTDAQVAAVCSVPENPMSRSTAQSRRHQGKWRAEELAALAAHFGLPVEVFYLSPERAIAAVLERPDLLDAAFRWIAA